MNLSTGKRKIGVVLMNLGGPTGPDAVQPFLYNLFVDPDIIKLGGDWRQRALAKLISTLRAKKVVKKYAQINTCANGCTGHAECPTRLAGKTSFCCSPINPLTELQRVALERQLRAAMPDADVTVYTAMRYWEPSTERTLARCKADGVTDVVLLPLYPQFSWTTTGSSFRGWEHAEKEHGHGPWRTFHVKQYHLDQLFLDAVESRIDAALSNLPADVRSKTHLVFSAHGTPISEVDSGDPYTIQIRETVQAIMQRRAARLGTPAEQYWLGFQSRVGPAKWTQPNTEDLVLRLMDYGIRNLLLIPIAFVTDHIETLMELNIELKEKIEEVGFHVESLVVTEGLNDHPHFIGCLARQVQHALAGEQPVSFSEQSNQPTANVPTLNATL